MNNNARRNRSTKSEEFEDIEESLGAMYDMENDAENVGSLFFSLTINTEEIGVELDAPDMANSIIHITNACYGEEVQPDSRTVVICKISETEEIPICVLNTNTHENHSLDLLFNESVSFVLRGDKPSAVTLTGYYQPTIFKEDLDADMEDELNNAEMKDYIRRRKAVLENEGDINSDIDVNSENDETSSPIPIQASNAAEIIHINDESDEEKEHEKEEDQKPVQKKKKKKKSVVDTSPPLKKRKINASTSTPTKKKEDTEEEKVATATAVNTNEMKSVFATPVKRKKKKKKKKGKKMQIMKGGIKYRDMTEGKGEGEGVKKDQKMNLYFVGQLGNGTVFDKCITGKGFEYTLGSGEVIKGWDIGLKGMKVGCKRKMIIPAKLGYGTNGLPPSIPPNSALTFTVQLLSIEG